jgi:hypothetical protein
MKLNHNREPEFLLLGIHHHLLSLLQEASILWSEKLGSAAQELGLEEAQAVASGNNSTTSMEQ